MKKSKKKIQNPRLPAEKREIRPRSAVMLNGKDKQRSRATRRAEERKARMEVD